MEPKRINLSLLASLLFVPLTGLAATGPAQSAHDYTEFIASSGNWTNAALWSDGVPNAFERTEIHGNRAVMIPSGTHLAGDLEIGLNRGDHTRVEVNGELILTQDSLRIGERGGGEGEFILKSGAMHCPLDAFIGGANGVSGRASRAVLRIQGGSFLGRSLQAGVGWGAESLVSIEGSHASAVHVLDYCYLQATTDSDGTPGNCLLSFTLDERGVTPITIQSRSRGLRIIKDLKSHCRLRIELSAIPPREDVTLVSGRAPIQGVFDELPEGSELTAAYGGRIYRWQLTYHGGNDGNDLVLKNRSEYAADAAVTHTRPLPEIPKPLWLMHPLYPLSAEKTGELAFPGAEGFGAFTPGGRGGKMIYVDNLDDSGAGSLRQAVETAGPRIIVFRVGGVIPLKSTLVLTEPFITIDGQNAPGAGIMLRNHGLEVRTHDVILRYLRVRVGDVEVDLTSPKGREIYEGGAGEHALYFIEGSKNCIADHLSLSWSTTKILSITKLSDRITVQWCILSEGLNFARHGYASLAGGNRVTWHHNLFAHNFSRNVRFQGTVDADFRNNVIYDWGEAAAYGEFDRLNYVGNYLKPGPSTTQKPFLFHIGEATVMPGSLFVTNNLLEGNGAPPGVNRDNWRGMGYYYFERASLAAREPFPAPAVTMESPEAAYEHVLKAVGATLPRRDAVDGRIVGEVREGSGRIIDWVTDVGGWPDFPAANPPESRE